MNKPESVQENEMCKILLLFKIETNQQNSLKKTRSSINQEYPPTKN